MAHRPHRDTAGSRDGPGRGPLNACARAAVAVAILTLSAAASVGEPEFCVPMRRPYVPPTEEEIAEYRDLIIADFEAYMSNVTRYFTCLDRERDRAMREVREVGEEYSAFLDKTAR